MEAKEKKFEATVQGFALTVTTPEVVVKNNVDQLVSFIEERVKDYDPAKYDGDADRAKKDRAELNKGADQVKQVRQSIQGLNPYGEVIEKLSSAEKLIKSGSDALNEIVKVKENEEKEAKRQLIQAEWDSKKFDLFALDSVFNPKWLNKTYKLTDIQKEITAIMAKAYADLMAIEKCASEDVDVLKAHYLMCRDLSETLAYGEELKSKRELAKKESEERGERLHAERIEEQKAEVRLDATEATVKGKLAGLVSDALDLEVEPETNEYTITVSVSDTQLVGIKNYLTMQGIEYECRELQF